MQKNSLDGADQNKQRHLLPVCRYLLLYKTVDSIQINPKFLTTNVSAIQDVQIDKYRNTLKIRQVYNFNAITN